MAYVVLATWRAEAGNEARVAEILREMMAETAREPGNLSYMAHQGLEDPRLFFLYEDYVDEPAFQTHLESEHFKRLVLGEALPLLQDRRRDVYRVLA
jgi:quinol monooxygenase YgiN